MKEPVIIELQETKDEDGTPIFMNDMEVKIQNELGNNADLILEYPVIYIHVWQNAEDKKYGKFSIYIGESENVIKRTKAHYRNAKIPAEYRTKESDWQFHLIEDKDEDGNVVVPTMYIIGHEYFNKSLTLALENKLIDYCDAMIDTARTYNGRPNPQGEYYGKEFFDDLFSKIWSKLRMKNKELFLSESKILKSAIYKSSPNHKLTPDQENAKAIINDRVFDAVIHNKISQLIFVEGEAGTGKTVLTSSTFYEMIDSDVMKNRKLDCKLLINHEEQFINYKTMAKQLGLDSEVVMNPTEFINQYSVYNDVAEKFEANPNKIADVVFIDEAHLLWSQSKQSFSRKHGQNQLDEIMRRSRITVIMFDENQVLRKEQYLDFDYVNEKRELSKSQGPDPSNGNSNYIQLCNQLRMNCDNKTMNWIDDLSKKLIVSELKLNKNKDSKGYEVKIFDRPEELQKAILSKANNKNTSLSRLVASYDWKYKNNKQPDFPKKYWTVDIGSWSLPWNEQHFHIDIEPTLGSRQKAKLALLDWAEKDYSINEVGSTFTIQGFDLDYCGVIIGPSTKYDPNTGRIVFEEEKRGWDKMTGNRTIIKSDGTREIVNVTNMLAQHELRVLLTRGTKGLYIYACDDKLREALKNALK